MFDRDEWIALITKLKQLTENDLLEWVMNPHGALIAQVNEIDYVIRALDWDNSPPWVLAVIRRDDVEGEPLARLESQAGNTENNPGSMLFGLRDLAYRSATGAGSLAKKLLADLDLIDPTPPPDVWRPTNPWEA